MSCPTRCAMLISPPSVPEPGTPAGCAPTAPSPAGGESCCPYHSRPSFVDEKISSRLRPPLRQPPLTYLGARTEVEDPICEVDACGHQTKQWLGLRTAIRTMAGIDLRVPFLDLLIDQLPALAQQLLQLLALASGLPVTFRQPADGSHPNRTPIPGHAEGARSEPQPVDRTRAPGPRPPAPPRNPGSEWQCPDRLPACRLAGPLRRDNQFQRRTPAPALLSRLSAVSARASTAAGPGRIRVGADRTANGSGLRTISPILPPECNRSSGRCGFRGPANGRLRDGGAGQHLICRHLRALAVNGRISAVKQVLVDSCYSRSSCLRSRSVAARSTAWPTVRRSSK